MIFQRIVLALIRWYQRWLSPVLPPSCRFDPSCSEYARQAVELHGVSRGSWLALRRILRCQPFCRGGFDPVPEPDDRTGNQPGVKRSAIAWTESSSHG